MCFALLTELEAVAHTGCVCFSSHGTVYISCAMQVILIERDCEMFFGCFFFFFSTVLGQLGQYSCKLISHYRGTVCPSRYRGTDAHITSVTGNERLTPVLARASS